VSEAQSQAPGDAAALKARQQEFSEETFHEYLLNFIVADDQVRFCLLCFLQPSNSCLLVPNPKSLNVVEIPEFRQLLLLLRPDLRESLIPHRTKMRELVIRAWRQHFQVLRRDLMARLPQLRRLVYDITTHLKKI